MHPAPQNRRQHCRSKAAPVALEHGWRLAASVFVSSEVIEDFLRPAVEAIPESMARRLKPCQIALPQRLEGGQVASRWTEFDDSIQMEVATADP